MIVKVMVIDNDPANLDVMTLAMELEGFEVKAFITAENLLDRAAAFLPDVILMDIELGKYDGRRLCLQLKQDFRTGNIPVIVISASGEQRLASALEYGADLKLAKPFDINDLLNAVISFGK